MTHDPVFILSLSLSISTTTLNNCYEHVICTKPCAKYQRVEMGDMMTRNGSLSSENAGIAEISRERGMTEGH